MITHANYVSDASIMALFCHQADVLKALDAEKPHQVARLF
ncbi:MAG: hypothetical protein ACI9AH_000537 [Oceanospirillaceae bacterium]|jgi:hypothetical protein|tara:strand:- start:242 stop:361 length:120 start_codon:yes stop_codon:yes gene_type:complete